jgi:hypothetical protein
MFEGATIPSPYAMEVAIPWIALLWVWVLTLTMRHLFPREWQLTLHALWKPRLLWGRQMGESSKTAGQIVSHLMGIMPYGILLWAMQQSGTRTQITPINLLGGGEIGWGLESGTTAWWWGISLGGIACIGRLLLGVIGGWLTERPEVTRMQLETDRYMRNHFSVAISLLLLIGVIQSQEAWNPAWVFRLGTIFWGIWLIWKWLRFIQLIQIQSIPFGWGIAYLCTMEIVPSGVLLFSMQAAGN